jgi:hypothetical protein
VHILSESERLELEPIAFKGIPKELRRDYWNACTGIKAYQSGYCPDYYQMLV